MTQPPGTQKKLNAAADGSVKARIDTTCADADIGIGAVTERVKEERAEAFNPYVLTAHKHNYISARQLYHRYQRADLPAE